MINERSSTGLILEHSRLKTFFYIKGLYWSSYLVCHFADGMAPADFLEHMQLRFRPIMKSASL